MPDYCPIYLIGCIYKVISKVLANRLKVDIGSVIDETQNAFIAGRNILDGPLMINELVSWLKKTNRKALLFKVDFNKAFDSLNWCFLVSIMEQLGFPPRWNQWIMGCLQSSRTSVLVNGAPTKEFMVSKGVRQGDPLSPFLFVIVMEALNVVMYKALQCGDF